MTTSKLRMDEVSKRSAEGAIGLDAKYITSERIFASEQEQVFSKRWLCVGHASQFQAGRLQTRMINGQSLIFSTDMNGVVDCLYNVCRHRGAQLLSDESILTSDEIVCPYHAWCYSASGDLKHAPNMREVLGFDKEKFGLGRVACRAWKGLIWINFTEQPGDFDEWINPLDKLLEPWQIETLSVGHSIRYDIHANWKLLFQNYNECYHCPTVHPALNRLTPYKNSSNDLKEGSILGGPMQLGENVWSMTTDGELIGDVLPGLSDQQKRVVAYYTLFPSLFISVHPDYVMLHRIEAIDTARTVVFCDFLFSAQSDKNQFERAYNFWDETNRQDWNVCELVQQGMKNRGYEPGPYSNLESIVAAFDRYYLKTINLNEE